jgi:hypothetical protein
LRDRQERQSSSELLPIKIGRAELRQAVIAQPSRPHCRARPARIIQPDRVGANDRVNAGWLVAEPFAHAERDGRLDADLAVGFASAVRKSAFAKLLE